jgi:cell shape-determining protein MreC
MSILSNWDRWKDFLADKMHQAENIGMNSETINKLATNIGDYLAEHVDPKNEQERLLSDLWTVADENERNMIARLIMKLVANNGTQKQPELQK